MALTPTAFGDNPQQPMVAAEVFIPDQLIAGVHPLVTDTVTITGGVKLLRGSLLGQVTASGGYKLAAAGATDGSQNPVAVLADDADASAADVSGGIYLAGEFNANAMTFGAGITAAAVKSQLALHSIYLKGAVSAADPN